MVDNLIKGQLMHAVFSNFIENLNVVGVRMSQKPYVNFRHSLSRNCLEVLNKVIGFKRVTAVNYDNLAVLGCDNKAVTDCVLNRFEHMNCVFVHRVGNTLFFYLEEILYTFKKYLDFFEYVLKESNKCVFSAFLRNRYD